VFDAMLLPTVLIWATWWNSIASPTTDLPANVIGLVTASLGYRQLIGRDRNRGTLILLLILLATAVCFKLFMAFFAGTLSFVVILNSLRRPSPSPGTPGEGRGEGDFDWREGTAIQNHPNPLPEYREREPYIARSMAVAALACAALILPWLARGIVLSGYPLYPSTLGAVNVSWKMRPADAHQDVAEIKSWAQYEGAPRAGNDWSWLGGWLRKNFTTAREAFYLPIALVVIAVAVSLLSRKKLGVDTWILLAALMIAAVIWFWMAPSVRFGLFLFWAMAAIAVASMFSPTSVRYALILVIGVSLLILFDPVCTWMRTPHMGLFAAMQRTLLIAPDARNGLGMMPKVEMIERSTDSGLRLWVPVTGDQCWDAPLPCTPYFNPDLRLRIPGDIESGFVIDKPARLRDPHSQ
jgi:hypothetical protein